MSATRRATQCRQEVSLLEEWRPPIPQHGNKRPPGMFMPPARRELDGGGSLRVGIGQQFHVLRLPGSGCWGFVVAAAV